MVKNMGKGSRLLLLFAGLAGTSGAQSSPTVVSGLRSTTVAEPSETALGASPESRPIDLGTGRGDMELGLGFTYMRFNSAPFAANTYGLNTSFTYYVSDWMGIEGGVSSAFGSQSSSTAAARSVFYGTGMRAIVPHRELKMRPWAHVLFGGLHMFPQTANSNSGIAVAIGGGADVRLKSRLWVRSEGNYIRSQLYSQGQNNFQVTTGILYRF